jgi:hypothetical protein
MRGLCGCQGRRKTEAVDEIRPNDAKGGGLARGGDGPWHPADP